MRETPIWKPLLILAVLALCAWLLYPPKDKLRLGLDLAGGTTMIYEVEIPPDTFSPQQVLDDTIAVLRQRVDPQGVRNLTWRVQGASRIEIQMPLAPPETIRLREAFTSAQDRLLDDNLSEHELDSTLRLTGQARVTEIERLAAGSERRAQAMRELAQAYDALTEARLPYDEAQQQYRQAQAALEALPPDTSREQREEMRADVDQALERLIPLAATFNQARSAYDAKRQEVLASNIGGDELDQLFALYDPNPRNVRAREAYDNALQRLIERHPQREEQIRALADLNTEYARVKGPLDDPNDLIALLRGSGVLEFRIAANPRTAGLPIDEYRQQLQQRGPGAGRDRPWRWFTIDDIEQFVDDRQEQELFLDDPEGYLEQRRGLVGAEYGGRVYLLLANYPGASLRQEDEGWDLTSVGRTRDRMGAPAVAFNLNPIGAQLMGDLTSNHLQQPMAIVLDGRIISAPNINDRITSSGIITGGRGGFTQREMDYLVQTLGAGSLQAQLSDAPVSIQTTGPSIGADNLRSGLRAAILSLILVATFMLVYYLRWGLIADFVLFANMLIILGVMSLLEATFTLPGIAGIVLTIGMAVDANVLIFERIREELERKADLATAIRLGYEKALSTIVDANLTTLITCIVLGYTATAEVKGFAVTLGIGIVATLFTTLFAGRVIVDLYVRYARPRKVNMLPTIFPTLRNLLSPNVDWLGLRRVFVTVSAVLMIAGLTMVWVRGSDMLDIEFRSGTQVGIALSEGQALTLAEARERLDRVAEQMDLPQLASTRAQVVTVGQVTDDQASAFTIAVVGEDADSRDEVTRIGEAIKTAFADVLDEQRPIHFRGLEAEQVTAAPVFALRDRSLGANIGRPEVDRDVRAHLGGVAVVLDAMSPSTTIDDLSERIRRMRVQPAYEELSWRPFEVIGLDRDLEAEEQAVAAGRPRQPYYRSAVVVSRDSLTNYVEDPDAFAERGGLADTEWRLVRDALQRDTSLASVASFSSQVSATMKQQAIAAIALSLLAVVAYIWFRFGSLRYGLAAILALIHDVSIALGLVAICGYLHDSEIARWLLLDPFKINLALVAAMLTLIGYSLNDTIIVFDRIRENRGRLAFATPAIINDSINQTISRTVITSGTTIMAIFVLYLFGGAGVHGFAFAMLVGVIVGTYSSVAVAAPLLMLLASGEQKQAMRGQGPAAAKPVAAT